jgi:hypothetical protein
LGLFPYFLHLRLDLHQDVILMLARYVLTVNAIVVRVSETIWRLRDTLKLGMMVMLQWCLIIEQMMLGMIH